VDTSGVKKYFEQQAGAFDSIYSEEKSLLWRFLDRWFRKDIYERFRLTMEACGDLSGKSVLDVGCGSGRYALEYAKAGASLVHGVDLSQDMIELAEGYVKAAGCDDRCVFEVADFMTRRFERSYDFVTAMGVMDYVADPAPFIVKMLSVAGKKAVASFPSRSFLRGRARIMRYRLKGCPVFLYDERSIKRIIESGVASRCRDHSIEKIPGWGYDFIVVFEK